MRPKSAAIALAAATILAACGGTPETAADAEEAARLEAPPAEAAPRAVESDPCAALDADLVRYDTSGTPFPYSFLYPQGWEVKTMITDQSVHADLVTDSDGDGTSDFILRLGGSLNTVGNVSRLVEMSNASSRTEETLETEVDGRTLHVSRTRIGEMVGFNGLFPVAGKEDTAYTLMGGITDAPDQCMDRAVEVMQEIMLSLENSS